MTAPTFDLQSHSLHSDGELAPAAVVAAAATAGVELLALTDHDTVAGVAEARAAATERGEIRVVPAVELSSVDAGREDLHVLGYLVDPADDAFAARLAEFRADRERRVEVMAERLGDLGLALDRREIDRRRAAGDSVGRPHLAQAVLGHPDNAARLSAEGCADGDAFFARYLVPGGAAYVRRERPTVAEAIAAVHDAGGVAVWAHPFWDVADPAEVLGAIDRFRRDGLDGVEAFYATHTAEQTALVADHCAVHGLLTTGSADFHGPGHPLFSRFRAFSLHGRTPDLGPIAAL